MFVRSLRKQIGAVIPSIKTLESQTQRNTCEYYIYVHNYVTNLGRLLIFLNGAEWIIYMTLKLSTGNNILDRSSPASIRRNLQPWTYGGACLAVAGRTFSFACGGWKGVWEPWGLFSPILLRRCRSLPGNSPWRIFLHLTEIEQKKKTKKYCFFYEDCNETNLDEL